MATPTTFVAVITELRRLEAANREVARSIKTTIDALPHHQRGTSSEQKFIGAIIDHGTHNANCLSDVLVGLTTLALATSGEDMTEIVKAVAGS